MQQPPVPENESKRIEALLTYQILDTLPEQVFNDLTLIASQICKTPVALFGLIDQNRQWFKSKIGIDLTEVPRDLAFCAHTIGGSNSLVVPDLSNDPRFADHPFVTGAPHARYYAGAPIVTKEGLSVGAICVVDTVPHEIDRDQIQALEAIARQILSHLETRNLLIRERELSTELSLSKVQLDEFFDLARDFLVVCEADGRFSRVSQSLVNVLGYTEEEIFSTPFINFLHPDDVESTRVGVDDNVVIGKARTISNRYRTKEGRYVNLSWNYASNSDGKIYAVARDVTEQLALEHNLILAKEKAEAATAAKARFLANMSHEIRTPMNGIIGMASLLIGSSEDPVHIERLNIIQKCGDNLLELINDILDFSKIEVDKIELERQPFAVKDTVREVMDLLGAKASVNHVKVNYRHGDNVPAWVLGDATRFRQVLSNLLSNALKFTERGSVEISTRAQKNEQGATVLEVSVKDSGIGISAQNIGRLFSAFTQEDASTTRRFGGSGLGLAICKGLAEKMGGRIWVESELGKGSCFKFTVLTQETAALDHEKVKNPFASYAADTGKTKPLRILVAEDNRTNQIVISALLGKVGYVPRLVSDGGEALQILESEVFDVIFMDCHMPVLDGFETSRAIIKKFEGKKRPYIIALTASTLKEDIDLCFSCGMDGFLSKPITMPPLFKSLNQVYSNIHSKADEGLIVEDNGILRQRVTLDSGSYFASLKGLEGVAFQVLESSLQTIPAMLEAIEGSIKKKDIKSLRTSSHRLKSLLTTLYAESARVAAYDLESRSLVETFETENGFAASFERLAMEITTLLPLIVTSIEVKK